MKRTEIPCPECMKKKLLTSDDKNANCDNCGTEFVITAPNTVRYATAEDKIVSNPKLACISSGGKRVPASAFVYRKKITDSEAVAEIRKLPLVKADTIKDIDDGSKYEWVQVGQEKYGRCMYCLKTGIRRGQTMGEFYGGGIVD